MIDVQNDLYKKLGLSDFEFERIKTLLGRDLNTTETYLFSAMWSEHCGYSHSKKYLSRFPKANSILSEENAGGVQIDDSIIFFKAESHNHPCAIEPFQGAATGIGGIIRDVLALNARPIALLDSLKFGKLNSNHSKHLFDYVVKGISAYGNSIGVPTVAGEVAFDEVYETSPLVNVMAVGIADKNEIKLSIAPANSFVMIVGSRTGRDGIFGASFASKELSEKSNEDRPSVQVGDPFMKKNLIEATLEILKLDNVLACQDCGAAGLLSSTSEMAYKGKCGMELLLDNVHLREEGMAPWEIMLSESQERMIFIVNQKGVDEVFEIAKKYEIQSSLIGKTIEKNEYRLFFNDKLVANVPPSLLNEPFLYDLSEIEPQYIKDYRKKECEGRIDVCSAVKKMVKEPNFASKRYVYQQYDYMVQNRNVVSPNRAGAAGLWLFENGKVLGLSMDSAPRSVFLDPYKGSIQGVYEAYRNLVSSGFKPLGITDCLNFGNPQKDEVGYQFVKSVDGISKACKMLNIPVVSGNVSFYNECESVRVYPTPTIGIVGVCDSYEKVLKSKFQAGEYVYLLGNDVADNSNVAGSLYQKALFDFLGGEVSDIDFELEQKFFELIFKLRDDKMLTGAIDVSEGGLFCALLEGLFGGKCGFSGDIILKCEDEVKFLFGEIPARYLISSKYDLNDILSSYDVPYRLLGKCGGKKIEFNNYEFDFDELNDLYQNSIENEVENV